MTSELLSGHPSEPVLSPQAPGRAEERDRLAAISAIDTEVFLVHGDHGVLGKQLTHPDQAQIRKVGLAIQRLRSGRCRQCLSGTRKSLAGGEILGAADFSGVAKEALVSSFGPGALELVTDNSARGQTGPPTLLLEPLGEFRRKTNADCMTHTAKR